MLLQASDLSNMHVSKYTEMCLFTTELIYPSPSDPTSGKIIVTYTPPSDSPDPSPRTIDVPLEPEYTSLPNVAVKMHSSPTQGYNMGPTFNTWFSACFGFDVILAYIGDNRREILGNMPPGTTKSTAAVQASASWLSTLTSNIPFVAPTPAGIDEGIPFSDCAPYLVISEASHRDASGRLPAGEDMDITKFRPNIVVADAATAFEEDYWAELAVGECLKIVLTQNCTRCNSLNVDYRTGKVAKSEAG